MFAEFRFQAIWLGKKCKAVVSPNLVPEAPGFGHVFRIPAHDLFGREKTQNRNLRKAAEEELFVGRSLEPLSSLFRMHMPAPKQGEPNIRIKEIQRIRKYLRWSDPLWDPLKR